MFYWSQCYIITILFIFTAVTICNNNPIKYSELQTQANKNLSDLIDEGWNATVENDDGIPSFRVTYAKLAESKYILVQWVFIYNSTYTD